MLLDSGAQATLATDDGVTALHTAAFHGSEAASRLLVDAGANVSAVNFDQETPLHVAAMFGHTAVLKLLIESNSCLEVWEFLVDDASRQGKACRTWSPWPLAPE
ncbi:Ankyrin repeat-containing domain protein [Ophiocordyceps sinensis CO18]|nr:Ankyrin repeat-containing domain protein [Ophiocordyceps sinensis CO18]